ncbi:catalase [Undibacterium piscinae]|uniref:Catalase n=1 Tax=Undibacterium piscinae TaxID=2495591 RepID=A0A6M4ABH2_9BURK|nr:catalase [Undibacterium piscinae]
MTVSGSSSAYSVASSGQTGLALVHALDKVDTTSAKGVRATGSDSGSTNGSGKSAGETVQLSDEAKAAVRSLQARDRQVRAHEQAHLAASGGLATSGASYTYQKGPDGVSYAIGGEVSIDVSEGNTPQDTIVRAITIRSAALAPADPSGPDRAIAAQASQMAGYTEGLRFSCETRHAYENTRSLVSIRDQGHRNRLAPLVRRASYCLDQLKIPR